MKEINASKTGMRGRHAALAKKVGAQKLESLGLYRVGARA